MSFELPEVSLSQVCPDVVLYISLTVFNISLLGLSSDPFLNSVYISLRIFRSLSEESSIECPVFLHPTI